MSAKVSWLMTLLLHGFVSKKSDSQWPLWWENDDKQPCFFFGGGIPHSGQPHYRWWVGGSSHPWPRLWNDGTWIAVAIPKWLYKDFRLVTSYSSGTFLLWTIVIYCHLPIFLDNKHIFFKNSEAKKEGWAFFGRAARRPLGTGFLGGVSPTDVDREKYRILLISLI